MLGEGDAAVADFTLNEGEEASFVLGEPDPRGRGLGLPPGLQHEMLTATVGYWRHWLSKCTYRVVARNGPPLGPGPQATDLRPHRCHRRRPDLCPGRGAGRLGGAGRRAPNRLDMQASDFLGRPWREGTREGSFCACGERRSVPGRGPE